MKLIEIMCCALAVTAFACDGRTRISPRQRASFEVRGIHPTAENYRFHHPSEACPTLEKLRVEQEISGSTELTDPWGTPYRVTCTDAAVVVGSAGPDRTFDTPDDITEPATKR